MSRQPVLLALSILAFGAGASIFAGGCTGGTDAYSGRPMTGAISPEDGAGSGAGSAASGEDVGPSNATGLPCEVQTILASRCQGCHGPNPQYGASDPLVTYDDLQVEKSGKKLYELVGDRIHQDTNPMPPGPNPRLTESELNTLDTWIRAGAPRATQDCGESGATSGALGPKSLGCTPDLTITPKAGFKMPKVSDLYVCAGVDIDVVGKRHITAIGPHVDNSKILHHVLLMQSTEPVPTTPYVCDGFGSALWKLVYAWAPGTDNFVLPPEAGFPYDKTSHWVIQFHYNNAKGLEGETDNSGFDVCTTDQLRANDAGVIAFGSMVFAIPPRSKTTTTCSVPAASTGKLIRSMPHMHNYGVAMKASVTPIGGTEKVFVDDKTFSFQEQISYPLDVDVKLGDIVTTSCTWNNTSDQTITWGEGTGNEMCFNFTTYYPAIGGSGATALPWSLGSLNPVCVTTSE